MKKIIALTLLLIPALVFAEIQTDTGIQSDPSGSGLRTGTLTDGKYCTYSSTSGLVCTSDGVGSMTWPSCSANGVVRYNGSNGWASCLYVGTGANNLVQLNASAQLPAVSGALLTNLPSQVSDASYSSSWSGVTAYAPSKNAIYNYLESKLPSGSDGNYKLVMTNNTSASPTSSTNELYFEGNVLKVNQNGTEYSAAIAPTGGQVVFSGSTASRTITVPDSNATMSYLIASGTASLGTSQIASGACASAVTVSASGVATTDVILWGFNSDPTSTTGYQASANGMLTIIAYPTSNNVNFKVCNNTSSAITPGAVTLNWRVIR